MFEEQTYDIAVCFFQLDIFKRIQVVAENIVLVFSVNRPIFHIGQPEYVTVYLYVQKLLQGDVKAQKEQPKHQRRVKDEHHQDSDEKYVHLRMFFRS